MQTGKPRTTTGFKRLFNAAGYSIRGLRSAIVNETAFRQEVVLAVVLVPLGIWLGDGVIEKILLVGCLLLVLIVELLNSAIENVVDRIGPEHHTLSGLAKDHGSAAVLIALVLTLFVWAMILLPRVY
jgi:diacylglycerol kinase (ATP)